MPDRKLLLVMYQNGLFVVLKTPSVISITSSTNSALLNYHLVKLINAPEMITNALEMGRLEDVLLNQTGIFSFPPGEHKERDKKTLYQQGPTLIMLVKPVERFHPWGIRAQLVATAKENEAVAKVKAAKKRMH